MKTTPRKLSRDTARIAASEISRATLRMRIACYLTDDGEINRSLVAEVAGILTLAGSTSFVLRPSAPETIMLRDALDSLMAVARNGCYWRKSLASALDYALLRSSELVTRHVARSLPALEAASMVEMAILSRNFSALDMPQASFARLAA